MVGITTKIANICPTRQRKGEKMKDGGQAFPQFGVVSHADDRYDSTDFGGGGMTLRDYFAIHWNMDDVEITPEYAEYVTGIKKPNVAWNQEDNNSMRVWAIFWMKVYACLRYKYADAMIAEKERR